MKKIKQFIYKVTEGNAFIKKTIKFVWSGYKYILCRCKSFRITPDEKTVLFMTFSGRAYGCSPKAIYEYMVSSERFKDWKLVWLFDRPEEFVELSNNPNTLVLKNTAKNREEWLCKAKYWVSNYRFAEYIWPRKDQVYIQCWHGTPLKRLGYDLTTSENAVDSMKDIRRIYDLDARKYTHILSPSPYASEKFISAWDLKTKGMTDKVLEIGYPRNDFLSNYTEKDKIDLKERLGIPKEKKVILYAPTWRDNQRDAGVGFTYDLRIDFEKLQKELGDEYVLVFRLHYLVANAFSFEKYEGFIYDASSYTDINHLYVIADLLVTDYSSVFFDYAVLKKPMLFYMYDLKEYSDSIRGVYFDINELPGPIIQNEDELAGAMKEEMNHFQYNDKYQKFNEKFNPWEDGKASERLVNKVFG